MIHAYEGAFIGGDVCRALGIDPNGVSDITIYLPAGDIATIAVELKRFDGDALVEELRHYQIVPREMTE